MEFCLGSVASVSVLLLCHYLSNLPPPKARCCETKDEWVTAQVIQSTAEASIQKRHDIMQNTRSPTTQRLMTPHLDAHCYTLIVVGNVFFFCSPKKKSAYARGSKTNRWPALEGLCKASSLISLPNIRWERFVPWPFFTAGSVSTPWTPLNRAAYAAWLNAPRWGPSSAPPST